MILEFQISIYFAIELKFCCHFSPPVIVAHARFQLRSQFFDVDGFYCS